MSTRIERLEQQAAALELRLQGASLRAIAKQTGMSLKTVERRVKAALRELPAETPDEARRTVETRFDGLLKRQYDLLASGTLDPRTQTSVVNSIVNVESARVRLLGIATPSTIVVQLEQEAGLR